MARISLSTSEAARLYDAYRLAIATVDDEKLRDEYLADLAMLRRQIVQFDVTVVCADGTTEQHVIPFAQAKTPEHAEGVVRHFCRHGDKWPLRSVHAIRLHDPRLEADVW
jgi:hypothetical protein